MYHNVLLSHDWAETTTRLSEEHFQLYSESMSDRKQISAIMFMMNYPL